MTQFQQDFSSQMTQSPSPSPTKVRKQPDPFVSVQIPSSSKTASSPVFCALYVAADGALTISVVEDSHVYQADFDNDQIAKKSKALQISPEEFTLIIRYCRGDIASRSTKRRMIGWLASFSFSGGLPIDWLIDWLNVWLSDWLLNWLIDWLICLVLTVFSRFVFYFP